MTENRKVDLPLSFSVGRLIVGIFNYNIGWSCRDIKIARVVDAGYIKFWWSK